MFVSWVRTSVAVLSLFMICNFSLCSCFSAALRSASNFELQNSNSTLSQFLEPIVHEKITTRSKLNPNSIQARSQLDHNLMPIVTISGNLLTVLCVWSKSLCQSLNRSLICARSNRLLPPEIQTAPSHQIRICRRVSQFSISKRLAAGLLLLCVKNSLSKHLTLASERD